MERVLENLAIGLISGLISSTISVFLIIYLRNVISIKRLKENYVCADRFYYISEAIEKFETYERGLILYYGSPKKLDIEVWKSFYKNYSFIIYRDIISLLNPIENEKAIENIKHSMGFEWNFKLMALINNVEISSYSLKNDYKKLENNNFEYYKKWNDCFTNIDENDLLINISNYDSFLIMIKNNIEAWKMLIKYFNYDYFKEKETNNKYTNEFNKKKIEYLRLVIKEKRISIKGIFEFNSENTIEKLLIYNLLAEQLIEIQDECMVATKKGLESI